MLFDASSAPMASSRFEYFKLNRWGRRSEAWHPCGRHLDNMIARNLLDDTVQNFIMPLPWLKTTNPPLLLWQKIKLMPGIYVIDSFADPKAIAGGLIMAIREVSHGQVVGNPSRSLESGDPDVADKTEEVAPHTTSGPNSHEVDRACKRPRLENEEVLEEPCIDWQFARQPRHGCPDDADWHPVPIDIFRNLHDKLITQNPSPSKVRLPYELVKDVLPVPLSFPPASGNMFWKIESNQMRTGHNRAILSNKTCKTNLVVKRMIPAPLPELRRLNAAYFD